MDIQELADKFKAKVAAAVVERDEEEKVADDNSESRSDDAHHCKVAMEEHVVPFFTELKECFPDDQFSFATQIDRHDHKVVGLSFKIGDGAVTNILTAFGNVSVTRSGASGSSKGVAYVYPHDQEPYIYNSGDLTRDKMAKLVEMNIDGG
jgi:hypothetical protein